MAEPEDSYGRSIQEDGVFKKKPDQCHICFRDLGTDRLRDHCHVTGNFRGAAHNACYLNLKNGIKSQYFFFII